MIHAEWWLQYLWWWYSEAISLRKSHELSWLEPRLNLKAAIYCWCIRETQIMLRNDSCWWWMMIDNDEHWSLIRALSSCHRVSPIGNKSSLIMGHSQLIKRSTPGSVAPCQVMLLQTSRGNPPSETTQRGLYRWWLAVHLLSVTTIHKSFLRTMNPYWPLSTIKSPFLSLLIRYCLPAISTSCENNKPTYTHCFH